MLWNKVAHYMRYGEDTKMVIRIAAVKVLTLDDRYFQKKHTQNVDHRVVIILN